MVQRVLGPVITLIGEAQPAMGAGEQERVFQLLDESQFGQVNFQRSRIVGQVPIDPALEIEKFNLQGFIAKVLGAGQSVARAGQAVGVIAPTPVEVDDGGECAEGGGLVARTGVGGLG